MNTYYQKNKEKLKEIARNCNHQQGGKEKAKEYYVNKKKQDCKNKHEINIQNYLVKKIYKKRISKKQI